MLIKVGCGGKTLAGVLVYPVSTASTQYTLLCTLRQQQLNSRPSWCCEEEKNFLFELTGAFPAAGAELQIDAMFGTLKRDVLR
ncbi:unnamed protein product [Amaranthus hypochondriacus]